MNSSYQELYRRFCKKALGSEQDILGFYDAETEYFNFDALWQNSVVKSKVVRSLTEFVSHNVPNLNKVTKILGTDTVTINYSFGTLPLVSPLCDLLGKDLVIWSEYGSVASGASRVFGRLTDNDEVLVIHDLLRETITLRAVLDNIADASKCKVNGIVVLVNITGKTMLSQLVTLKKIQYPIPIYSFVSV